MPAATLEEIWESFGDFDPNASFVSELRDTTKETIALIPTDLVQQTVGGLASKNGLNIQRMTGGRIALDFGLSVEAVQTMKTFYDAAKQIREGVELLQMTGELFRQISQTFSAVFSAVPILGSAVALGQAVGSLVQIVKQREEAAELPPDQALAYRRDADEQSVMSLMNVFETGDWTRIFMPAQTDFGWIDRPIEFAPGFVNQGLRYAPENWDNLWEGSGLSCVPGLAEQMGIYEYPFEQPPGLHFGGPVVTNAFGKHGGRGSPFTPVSTAGTVHPSMRQMALTLWNEAMRPSVASFSIDTHPIADAWAGYYSSMRDGPIHEGHHTLYPGQMDQLSLQILAQSSASVVRWIPPGDGRGGDGQRGGLQFTGEARFSGINLDKLGIPGDTGVTQNDPSMTKGPIFAMEDLIAVLVAELYKVQKYALGTIQVAYVDEDAPALKGDRQVLWKRHQLMRKLLLEHPARCLVDVERIPDTAYRNAMWDAQITCGGQDTIIAKGPKAKRSAEEIDPEGDPAPPPPDQGLPVPGPSVDSRPRIPTAAKVAGVAALGYALRKPLGRLLGLG